MERLDTISFLIHHESINRAIVDIGFFENIASVTAVGTNPSNIARIAIIRHG